MKKILLAAAAILCATASLAQENPTKCLDSGVVLERLEEQYGELPISVQHMGWPAAAVTVLTVNEETGTWTLFTINNNQSCILMAGGDYMRNER